MNMGGLGRAEDGGKVLSFFYFYFPPGEGFGCGGGVVVVVVMVWDAIYQDL